MIIRNATILDEGNIAKLIASFRIELRKLKGVVSDLNIEKAKEEFREYLSKNYPIFVAEDEEKQLCGYIVCRIDDNVVWAEAIYVSSDSRRNGVASSLYQRAEEVAKGLGNETVYNWVHPNNEKMINFLSKRGYNVLNLIEIRKAGKNEEIRERIDVGAYSFDY